MGKRTIASDIIDGFLLAVGVTATSTLIILAPNSLIALEKPLTKLLGRDRRKEAKRIAQYMKDKKLISVTPNGDDSYTVTLTKKGKRRTQKARFDRLSIPSQKWDSKWRIFMFDIPEKHKALRDFVSYHVKRLGFKHLQRSVFVFPYPIDDFVAVLCEVHPELRPYVVVLTTDEIDKHNQLVKSFKNIL